MKKLFLKIKTTLFKFELSIRRLILGLSEAEAREILANTESEKSVSTEFHSFWAYEGVLVSVYPVNQEEIAVMRFFRKSSTRVGKWFVLPILRKKYGEVLV